MNVMAVGWSVPSLLGFAGTIRRFRRDGHQISIVVVEGRDHAPANSGNFDGITEHTNDNIFDADTSAGYGRTGSQIRAVFAMSDLPEPEFIRDFDFASISQSNADILANCRKRIDPDLVIMPFWKSENPKDVVLARSLLIACRGVGSIIMYRGSSDIRNEKFSSQVSIGTILNPQDHAISASDPSENRPQRVEDFESHRILMLEEAENDWL
jgi:hypothetical protein